MKHRDQETPIRARWIDHAAGDGEEAAAGALFRAAAQHGPVPEKRLREIHARLRRGVTPSFRSAPRLLRYGVFAVALVLGGGVLAGTVARLWRRPALPVHVAPAPPVEAKPRPGRHRPGTRAFVAPENVAPEDARPLAPAVPAREPLVPSLTGGSPSLGLPRTPPRRVALREAPRPQRIAMVANPLVPDETIPTVSATEGPRARVPDVPDERPVPAVLPASPRPALPPVPDPAPSSLARDSRWLASAIAQLRQEGRPGRALAILDEHQAELGTGALAAEARATRIEALLRLGRNGTALALLEGQRLSAHGLGRGMLVARGELRAENGRWSTAIQDFDRILASSERSDDLAERALFGRAACRAKLGNWVGAHADLARYLTAFPRGRFVQEARSALSREIDERSGP